MRPHQARYVTACQQLLALGVVLVTLTPAASVVTLDVVQEGTAPGSRGVDARGALDPMAARVPADPVDATVDEVELTTASTSGPTTDPGSVRGRGGEQPDGEGTEALATDEATLQRTQAGELLVSEPQSVTGFGTIGVTWAAGARVEDEDLAVQVRTNDEGTWSAWTEVEYHDDHGPDPDSREAARTRPGTDALIVGKVDEVQVRVQAEETAAIPADLTLAVVDPGEAATEQVEPPALDTSTDAGIDTDASVDAVASTGTDASTETGASTDTDTDTIELQRATYTPKPQIFSRSQWGANESWRDRGSLRYFEVHAGFVHHTVTTNNYSRDQVPGIIRSIYAYHTRSRGWSDIGYNFLVDRFGRIWEGRYGGIDRPVVGAHTLGYNDYAFAMSAIGNYDVTGPSDAMLRSYGSLMAWKLSLHGVDPGSTRQRVGSRTFRAINGHRDAGSTACPGRYLYAKLPRIRELAVANQRDWSGRELESSLVGSAHPDVLARRASDKRLFVVPTGGLLRFDPASTGINSTAVTHVSASPDLTRDGRPDALVQFASGMVQVRPGNGSGGFATQSWRGSLAGHDMVSATGDLDGDGTHDWVTRNRATGELVAYLGRSQGGFRRTVASTGWGGYNLVTGVGDVTGDGRADLVVRTGDRLAIRPGNGSGGFRSAVPVDGGYGAYDRISGMGDFNRDGRNDLVVRRSDNALVFVIPGNGDGTFQRKVGPIRGLGSWADLSGGRVGGNGDADLIGVRGGQVVVRQHSGTFHLGRRIDTGRSAGWAGTLMRAGDWDRDGHGDIVGRRSSDGALFLLRGDGSGRLAKAERIASGFKGVRLLSAVGDVTGDGWPDLMGQPASGAMRIYPGRGRQGLRTSYVAHRAVGASQQIGIGRWDLDGAPDSLFRQGDRLRYYPGNGPGGLTSGSETVQGDVGAYNRLVGVSDMTLGGHADLLARDRATGGLWMLPGSRAKLGKRRFLGDGWNTFDKLG